MGWTTHLDAVRLDQRTWYYLWREDDDLSTDHPLLRAPSGAMLHASEADALHVAQRLAEKISSKPRHTIDLDAALAWLAAPQASNLDASLLMLSWHLLVDLDVLPSPVEEEYSVSPPLLEEIFDKLHWPEGAWKPPEWTPPELGLLAATLGEGIARLQMSLATRQSHDSESPAG